MKILRNRKGFTILEVIIVTGIMSLITLACMSLLIMSMKSFESTTVQTYSDSDAVIALQKIVMDVREAKSFKLLGEGDRLRLAFPKKNEDGYYDRGIENPDSQIDYYLSDEMGVPGHEGTYLWQGKSNDRRIVARNISSVTFEQFPEGVDNPNSIRITVVSSNNTSSGPKTTSLTQRVVYLRNY